MKKSIVIIFILMAMVTVAGCTSQSNEEKNKKFTGNNITFEYPADWVIANSQANDTIVAVADPRSVNPQTGYAQTLVVIQKRKGSLYQMYNENYAILFNNSSYQRISEGNITLGSFQALENTYLVTEGDVKKKQMAIWIQRGKEVYVILCSALVNEFDKEKANFDIIINSFKFVGGII